MTAPAAKLDDERLYRSLDRHDMLGRIRDLPLQCEEAWHMALQFPLPEHYRDVDAVLVCGMGGSAIGGDLLGGLLASQARLPLLVWRGYSLPAWINERTLVVASSYSGNTEETLACFEQALRRGARVLASTSGGKLKERAEQRGVPAFCYSYDAQPRAALAFSFLPLLCFLQKLGFLKDASADVAEAVTVLRELAAGLAAKVPAAENRAKALAGELHGRLVVVYGAELTAEVAHRWKTQLNENSKSWAFYEAFPELDHNAVVGYQFPAGLAQKTAVVMLGSSYLSERVKLRYDVTTRLLQRAGVSHIQCDGVGTSPLSHVLGLVMLGDYTSYYLSLLNGVDPTSVASIDYLKEELAKSSG